MNRQTDTIYEDEAVAAAAPATKTSIFQSPIKSKLCVQPSDDQNAVTLTHTVSFYRRQQTMNSPSVHQMIHSKPNHLNPTQTIDADDTIQSQEDLVQQKIKSLKDNVMIQNQQIAQASNALTTCASTFEFSGSTESVVAEWKLLVASK